MQTADAGGTQPVLTGAVQVSASTSPRTAASVAAPAAESTQGTQPVVTGAVRESAASMVEGQMPALVGIKKRGAEEESTPSVSTRKTPRSNNSELLQERSDEVIAQLLDCIAACLRQNDIDPYNHLYILPICIYIYISICISPKW